MKANDILKGLQELRTTLDAWGVTNLALWITGFVALTIFILSAREVLTWFFHLTDMRREIRQVKEELRELQGLVLEAKSILLETSSREVKAVEAIRDQLESAQDVESEAEGKKSAPRFRFDH